MRRNQDDRARAVGSEWIGSGGGAAPGVAHSLPWGDADAMGALLEEHRGKLLGVALRYTRDPDAAADVLQNAFEKVLKNGHQFRGGAKVSTWLYRVVANEALMWLRAERRRAARFASAETAPLEWAPDPLPGAVDVLADRQDVIRLRAALGALDPEERAVLEGCALGEQSYADWGREHGLHPAAAKSRAFRARQHLRELLT